MELDRTEARVLGALVEKRWTTPDQYPLSMNALVSACNQKSNRDPVMDLQEFEIAGCLLGLRPKHLVMVHERDGGRVPRYGEKLQDELGVSKQEVAILAELLLRGDQTAGELYRRCGRMAHFDHQGEMDAHLRELAERRLVHLQPKASGQRYARWTQLICPNRAGAPDEAEDEATAEMTDRPSEVQAAPPTYSESDTTASRQAPVPRAAADVPGPGRVAPPAGVVGSAKIHEPEVTASDLDALREELDALRKEVRTLREKVDTLEQLI